MRPCVLYTEAEPQSTNIKGRPADDFIVTKTKKGTNSKKVLTPTNFLVYIVTPPLSQVNQQNNVATDN
jgi:hypothetical protein